MELWAKLRVFLYTIAIPPPSQFCCGIEIDLYPGGHSTSGVMVSSSLIQVLVKAQRSMFLLEISTFRSADLFIINLQFMVTHCRLLFLPVMLSTSLLFSNLLY